MMTPYSALHQQEAKTINSHALADVPAKRSHSDDTNMSQHCQWLAGDDASIACSAALGLAAIDLQSAHKLFVILATWYFLVAGTSHVVLDKHSSIRICVSVRCVMAFLLRQNDANHAQETTG
jgi:hypothetical protein